LTKDEIMQVLRLTAMGRTGHPLQEQMAEKLATLFLKGSCEHCVMPGGQHFDACPNAVKRTRKTKAE
jgi:hypothetical protein